MVVIKRFNVLSVAKITALVSAVLFFVFGLAGIVMFAFAPKEALPPEMAYSTGSLVGAWILDTVIFAVLGFFGGALWAALYNLFAKLIGGIEVELDGDAVPAKKPLKR